MASRTVTFLFTDIEGSTRLWDESPETMRSALARHDALMRSAIASNGGTTFKTVGDAFCAAFEDAPAAVAATLAAQRALAEEPWATPRPIKVRMALHTGTAEARDDDYFGPPLNRVARLLATGHGGQTLVSAATYELVRDALPTGASLAPLGEHRLKDLARPETVYGLLHPLLASEFPALRSLGSSVLPSNLPAQTTSFVGREKEMEQVAAELKRTRLLTLLGPGGTGKTRLSLQAAADEIEAFPGGVWLVELAALEDPALVAQTVAGVLGVGEEAGKPLVATLAERFRKAPTLLLLDNCEHLIDAVARLADALIKAVPTLKILATSREPLGVAGEAVLRVPTLSLPRRTDRHTPESLSHFEAVRLFVERALAQKADFAVTNANAPALASLCLRLDGIPLAIELAAARARSLSVEQIEARLDDRFRLLTGGLRTALPRQQTLRALVEWSHDLLSEPERAVFRRLAAFVGGWTLEAAEAVVAGEPVEDWEVLDLLASLVDKSLATAEETDGVVRYAMLETLRHYAAEKLKEGGGEAEVVARHAAFFAALAAEQGPRCQGGGEPVRRLTADWDNLRAAMDRGTPAHRLAMAGDLRTFWGAKAAFREAVERAQAALHEDDPPSDDARRFEALVCAGNLAKEMGDLAVAIAASEEAVAWTRRRDDPEALSKALGVFAASLQEAGEMDRAKAAFEEALAASPSFAILLNMASLLIYRGEPEAAESLILRAEALLRDDPAQDSPYYRFFLLYRRVPLFLAWGRPEDAAKAAAACREAATALDPIFMRPAHLSSGETERALGRFEAAIGFARDVIAEDGVDAESRCEALVVAARSARALGRLDEAREAAREGFDAPSSFNLPLRLEAAGEILAAAGRPREAVVLLGASSAERLRRPMPIPRVDLPQQERLTARLREALGDGYEAAHAEGAAMDMDAAKAYAISALG